MNAPAPSALPDADRLRELVDWTPPLGVLSVTFSADPGDRSDGWQVQLKDDLRAVVAAHEDGEHERKIALRATAERLIDRFDEYAPPPSRTMVGFAELARDEDDATERWYGAELPLDRFPASFAAGPRLAALVELVDVARPRGVLVLSTERIRLLELVGGQIGEVSEFELETYELAWRERKAQRPPDPARGQATSASGKDQYGQRLDANRQRWHRHVAGDIAKLAGEEGSPETLILGEARVAERFIHDMGSDVDAVLVAEVDAISEPVHKIGERVLDALPKLDTARQLALVERVSDAAAAGGRGSLGFQETAQALAEGRVDRLLTEPERTFEPDPELAAAIGVDPEGWEPAHWLIESAIRTSAAVTLVRGEPAERLDAHEGVGAILRY